MEQERSHNRILLGSPESLYVETVSATDIKISVKQPVGGWIVGEIKPEVTSSCHKCHGFYCRKENFYLNENPGYHGLHVFMHCYYQFQGVHSSLQEEIMTNSYTVNGSGIIISNVGGPTSAKCDKFLPPKLDIK